MELLERGAALDALSEYRRDGSAGNGRFVLVAGEAGIGKTALLERFQQEAPDARWLWGACDGLFTPRPFQLLSDLAGQLGGDIEGLWRQRASREELFTSFLRQVDLRPGPGRRPCTRRSARG